MITAKQKTTLQTICSDAYQ